MFPNGPIWQVIREQALDLVRDDVKVLFGSPRTLSDWSVNGSYVVSGSDPRQFVIACSRQELAGVIFSEANLLMDHAEEQRRQIIDSIVVRDWSSPAWNVVTVYYWCFFLALAYSRLTGRSLHYLRKEDVDRLRRASTSNAGPGAGAYTVEMNDTSATSVTVNLKKDRNSNYHEAVWRFIHKEFESLANGADDEANLLESRIFSCLKEAAGSEDAIWPTRLRNVVNYRPGAAYLEVRKKRVIKLTRFAKVNDFKGIEDVVSLFERQRIALKKWSVEDHINEYSVLLVLKGVMLSLLCNELIKDITERRQIDRRWLYMRSLFNAELRKQFPETQRCLFL